MVRDGGDLGGLALEITEGRAVEISEMKGGQREHGLISHKA